MNPDDASAHTLWVELTTRITTQRLHNRSGDEETAAANVSSLFKKTCELLGEHPDAKAFETFALKLLNDTLGPYTARWHGWMTADKELRDGDGKPVLKFKDEWYRRQFRRELRELQPRLVAYALKFEALRDGRPPEDWWFNPNPVQLLELQRRCAPLPKANLGAPLVAGIGDQVRFAHLEDDKRRELWGSINEAERREIWRRRGMDTTAPVVNATALAFSGGGIRSATFCLGITQVLARRGLLKEFDYLSTVSGGGYFGAFLSTYLGSDDAEKKLATTGGAPFSDPARGGQSGQRAGPEAGAPGAGRGGAAGERIAETFAPAANQREPRPLRHLRNRSRYLVDGDFQGKVIGVGMVLVGVLFNLLILLPVPLMVILVTMLFRHQGWFGDLGWVDQFAGWVPGWDAPVSQLLGGTLGLTGVAALAYPWIKARSNRSRNGDGVSRCFRCWRVTFLGLLAVSVVLLSSWLVPFGFRLYIAARTAEFWNEFVLLGAKLEQLSTLLGVSAVATLGVLASKVNVGGKLGWLLQKLAILAGPLLYLFVFYSVGYRLMFAEPVDQWHWSYVLGTATIMVLWGWWLVDINTYSPHGYYRDRLAECYLIRPRKVTGESRDLPAIELEPANRLKLSELNATGIAPYHLINTTVNLPSSELREMRGRNGDFFVFSRHFCGSPMCGYYPTAELEAADPQLNLGTAMAISGAAASSNMGWQTPNSLRLVLTLANVRLGYWLRHPRLGTEKTTKMNGPGPLLLFREMFAMQMDERRHFLNLSDGGHIENLAVYELLRRRCKFIVCVDGGMEPEMQCEDLMRLERYAAIDLGIKMHYDLGDLMLHTNGYSRAYGVMVKIDYRPPADEAARSARKPGEAEWGWMLYLKLAMIGYAPGYVMDYKRQHPDFPHEPTGDQIYEEGQFEAYRALGEAAAESFFTEELIDGGKPANVEAWFQALVSALLPDNDEVFAKGS